MSNDDLQNLRQFILGAVRRTPVHELTKLGLSPSTDFSTWGEHDLLALSLSLQSIGRFPRPAPTAVQQEDCSPAPSPSDCSPYAAAEALLHKQLRALQDYIGSIKGTDEELVVQMRILSDLMEHVHEARMRLRLANRIGNEVVGSVGVYSPAKENPLPDPLHTTTTRQR